MTQACRTYKLAGNVALRLTILRLSSSAVVMLRGSGFTRAFPDVRDTLHYRINVINRGLRDHFQVLLMRLGDDYFGAFLYLIRNNFGFILHDACVTSRRVMTKVCRINRPIRGPGDKIPKRNSMVNAICAHVTCQDFNDAAVCKDRGDRINVVHAGPGRATCDVKGVNARLDRGGRATLLYESKALVRVLLITCLRDRQERTMEYFVESNAGVVTSIRNNSFVVITRNVLCVLGKRFTFQLCRREREIVNLSLSVERVNFALINGRVRMTPRANFARATNARVRQYVDVNGTRIFIRATRVSFFTNGEGGIVEVRTINLIDRVRLVSTQLINVYQGTIIQRSSDCPCNSPSTKAFACRLRGPCFVKVNGNRQLTATMVSMFLRRFDRRLSNFANDAQALRARMGRTSMISGSRHVRRFKATSGDHLASNCLGLIRVASCVVDLTYLFSLSRVLTNVPFIGVRRNTFKVYNYQVIVRLTGRSMQINQVKGSN